MIYVYNKDGLIYVTEKPRTSEDDSGGKKRDSLLYSFFSDDISGMKTRLRPWKCLSLGPGWYTQECKEYLKTLDLASPVPELKRIRDIQEVWKDVAEGMIILQKLDVISTATKLPETAELEYTCDLENYLSENMVSYEAKKVADWTRLEKRDKQHLIEISRKPTKESKLEYLEGLDYGTLENLYSFLPGYLKVQLGCLGISATGKNIPEFKDPRKLGGEIIDNPEKFLQEEIYNTFHVGEHWEGKEIKAVLGKIYSQFPNLGNPKVTDLEKYFDMSFFMYEGKGKYNLIKRLLF